MNNKRLDLITFGETMVVFNPLSKGPLRHVHSYTKSIGGAESNVAIDIKRLGHTSGWFSNLGDDEFGRYIEFVVRGEGVDVSRVATDTKHRTGILFKERFGHVNSNVYYYRENSASSHLCVDNIDEEYIKQAKILHITGITPALSESARQATFKAISIAKDNGVIVSFDPNIRLKLWDKDTMIKVLLEIANQSDIIFPGCDEAEILLGLTNHKEIIQAFHNMGNSVVALKLGKDGCIVSNKSEYHKVPGYQVPQVEDSVGAGDGFAAGFLSGYLKELSLFESGEYANAVGAMSTQVKGDMEGYPSLRQLLTFSNKIEHIDR